MGFNKNRVLIQTYYKITRKTYTRQRICSDDRRDQHNPYKISKYFNEFSLVSSKY